MALPDIPENGLIGKWQPRPNRVPTYLSVQPMPTFDQERITPLRQPTKCTPKSLPLWAGYRCARVGLGRCRPGHVALAREIIASFRRGYRNAR